MAPKPTLHSHTITNEFLIFNGVREPLSGLPSRTSKYNRLRKPNRPIGLSALWVNGRGD